MGPTALWAVNVSWDFSLSLLTAETLPQKPSTGLRGVFPAAIGRWEMWLQPRNANMSFSVDSSMLTPLTPPNLLPGVWESVAAANQGTASELSDVLGHSSKAEGPGPQTVPHAPNHSWRALGTSELSPVSFLPSFPFTHVLAHSSSRVCVPDTWYACKTDNHKQTNHDIIAHFSKYSEGPRTWWTSWGRVKRKGLSEGWALGQDLKDGRDSHIQGGGQ